MEQQKAKTKTEGRKSTFRERLQKSDQFGQAFAFNLGGDRNALPSTIGAICSIVLTITILSYAGYKWSILIEKKSVDIVQAVIENKYDDSYVFRGDDGLNFAVSVLNPQDPDALKPIDPSYGRVKISTR